MKRHYVYLPGFGGGIFNPFRRLGLLLFWRSRGHSVSFVPMHWTDRNESYQQKFARIESEVKRRPNRSIVVVGESAAGAMALYVLASDVPRVEAVVTVCGYNHGHKDLLEQQKFLHPAFDSLVERVDRLLPKLTAAQKRGIITIYTPFDDVVTKDHTLIDGSRAVKLSSRTHFGAIARSIVQALPTRV